MAAARNDVVSRATTRGLAGAGLIGIIGVASFSLLAWLRAKGMALALGPSGVGLYGQVWAFVLYVSGFASLGVGLGATALVAFHRERDEPDEVASIARAALVVPLVVGPALALLTLAGAAILPPIVLGEDEPWLIVLAALSIPFAAVQVPLQHVLQGFEDVKGQNVVYVAYGAVFTVAAVAGAYAWGVYGAALGLAIGNVFLAVLYLVRARRLLVAAGAPLRRVHGGSEAMRRLLRIGAASLAVTVAYGAADLAVRTTLLRQEGSSVAGYWFAILVLSVQFVGALAGAMSYFTAPLAARSLGRADRAHTSLLLDDSLRLAIVVIMPALMLLVALRNVIVGILFSDSFDPIARWLPAQLTGDAIRTVGWVLGVAFVPLGLTRAWLVTAVGSSVVFGGLGSLLALQWGLGGAVAAWIVTWTASTVATAAVLIRERFWRPSSRTLVGLAVTATGLAAARELPGIGGVAATAVATAVLVLVVTSAAERSRVLMRFRGRRG